MASSLALRRATSGAFSRLASHAKSASIASSTLNRRSFSSDTQMTTLVGDDRSIDVERRPESSVSSRRRESFPMLLSDVLDPLFPTRSLNRMLNMMDQFMDSPFAIGPRGRGGYGVGKGWDARETDDGLHLRVDMPGLDKDQVKVSVEQNTLVIKGEGEKESEDDEYGRRYSSRIDLPPKLYKLDGVKAEMKNGVLKVMVPKVKEEERQEVFQVSID